MDEDGFMAGYQTFTRAGLFMTVAVMLAATSVCVLAADSGAQSGKSAMAAFVYQPPQRGAPKARVGGGTRGTGGDLPELQVLAPDHVGLTTRAQPRLYWYAHSPVAAHIEFVIIDDDAIDPLLEIETGTVKVSGVQYLDLAEYNITLQPGVPYQWSVVLILDENSRSTDVIASGVVERIEPDKTTSRRLADSHGKQLVAAYANEGIWYDALDTISVMIEAAPADADLTEIRATLLDQVGLQSVVEK